MAIGYVASQAIKKYIDSYKAERDTKLRDYIIRHPELFPEPGNISLLTFLKRDNKVLKNKLYLLTYMKYIYT